MMPTIDDPRLAEPACIVHLPVETLHTNKWISVRNRGGYYTVEYNQPQVVILPVVDPTQLVFVKVYRPVIADITLELPSGGSMEGESPAQAAARELWEETGIKITDLNRFEMHPPLVTIPRSPCFDYIFQVRVTQEEFDSRDDHDHEIASVQCLRIDEVLQKITTGEFYNGIHMAIVMRYLLQNQLALQRNS
jgi:8-oxo-dGTP pyrophosphatase MutT (NUDIX family)